MKSIWKSSLILIASIAFLLASCKKEPALTLEPHRPQAANQNFVNAFTDPGDENEVDSTDLDILCLTFIFPVSVTYPDGNSESYDTDTSLYAGIDAWYEINFESEQDPMIVFPITVTLDDGSTKEVVNDEELCNLYFACYDDWEEEEAWEDFEEDEWDEDCDEFEHEECYEIQFPIVVKVGDTTYAFNSWDEADAVIYDLIEDLVEGEELDAELLFPITLLVKGETVIVNTEDDLEAIEDECYDGDDCFSIIYPITLNFPDGTSKAVQSDDELDAAIEDWEKENPEGNDDEIVPTFPFDVINLDSLTIAVVDLDQLESLEDDCQD